MKNDNSGKAMQVEHLRELNIKKLLGIIISGLIFSICIYYIFNYFQWRLILPLLKQVDWRLMPFAVSATILLFWLFRTMRWFVLLRASGIHVDFYRLYMIGAISVAFALLTPLQSGEALKVELLKKTGSLERIPGYGIFMTERILDLIVVLLMSLSGMILGISKLLDSKLILATLVLVLICFIVFFIYNRRISPDSIVYRFFQPLNQCIRSWKVLVKAFIFTIGGWFFIVLGWYACLCSISISLSLIDTASTTAITTLVGIFSLIPWSIGIGEISISALLVYFGQDVALAQAGALIIRVYGLLTLLLGGVIFLLWKLFPGKVLDEGRH